MFYPAHWAAAFINSLEAEGGDFDEGIGALEVFASWIKSLPGVFFGGSAAAKLEKTARDAILNTDALSPAAETALRFIVLMVRKDKFQRIDSVMEEVKKIMDKKRGVVKASLEYTVKPDQDFLSSVQETLKQKTGAVRVEIEERVNPRLIGGFTLRLGDEIIDASVRFQLEKLEAFLADGVSGFSEGVH